MGNSSYLLTVLSTGRQQYLDRMLASLDEHLHPAPAEMFVFTDEERIGQCAAHARCWQHAAESGFDWVFHIEEDFVVLRPIDVEHMTELMYAQPHLFQLSLMRQAWGAEIEWGGYVAKDPGWYQRRTDNGWEWIETTRNWANAPTLFRTDLAREFPWPVEPGCETTIGPQMLARYPEGRFGILGLGEVQACHIGVERAVGSRGY